MVEICHHYAEPITTHRTEKKILIIYLPQHCNMALTRKALPFPLFASQHEMKLAGWRQMAQQPTADWLKYFVHVGKFRTSILIGSGQNTLATVTVQDSNLSLVGSKGEVNRTGWPCYCLTYGLSSVRSVYETHGMWWTLRQISKSGVQHAEWVEQESKELLRA